MALNIKRLEGPKPPEWTDPHFDLPPGPSPSETREESLEDSNAHLLLLEDPSEEVRKKLKSLDII